MLGRVRLLSADSAERPRALLTPKGVAPVWAVGEVGEASDAVQILPHRLYLYLPHRQKKAVVAAPQLMCIRAASLSSPEKGLGIRPPQIALNTRAATIASTP